MGHKFEKPLWQRDLLVSHLDKKSSVDMGTKPVVERESISLQKEGGGWEAQLCLVTRCYLVINKYFTNKNLVFW